MGIFRVFVLVSALSVLAASLRAEPGPIGKWLMDDPLTLWDIGMIRAKEDAREAGSEVVKDIGRKQWTRVSYNWDHNEILITLSIHGFNDSLSHENCNEVRQYFLVVLSQLYVKLGSGPIKGIPKAGLA